jgi:zinc protease
MTIIDAKKLLATAFLLTSTAYAQAQIKLSDPVPIGPQVTIGHLANGLTYYIQPNAKPEKKIELRLVVKAGSILEDDDQQGLAHFTEHMAFKGSTHYKQAELISYLQSIGIKFGADLNAYTSFDETVYILPVPTERKENVDAGFQVLEDWAYGLSLTDADIDTERGVVLEELRRGKGANERMNKRVLPKLFAGSRYADRLPIGKEDLLKTFPYEAIRRFYRDWYRPDLMAVVVVGDITPADAEKLIHAHFDGLRNPDHPRPREYAKIAPRSASEALVVTDKETTNALVTIHYSARQQPVLGTFAQRREHEVDGLISAMLSVRLQDLARQPSPPFAVGISARGPLVRDYNAFSATALVGPAGTSAAITALVQENERARKFGFTASELARAKTNRLRKAEIAYNERDKTLSANFANENIRNFLNKETMPGLANEFTYAKELVPGITLEETNRRTALFIPPDSESRVVVFMGPEQTDAKTPAQDSLLDIVASAEKREVTAPVEKVYASTLMTPPKAGSIVSETSNAALGLTELVLSNGIHVVLKPTDFKNDQIIMQATRFGGQSLFGNADMFNARYATSVLGQMGVASFTPTDVQKMLTGKAVSVGVNLSEYSEGVSGSAVGADIETMLQLLHLKVTQPRIDPALYQSFIDTQRTLVKNTRATPEAVFHDALLDTLYGNNPRVAHQARPEDLDKISLDRTQAIYRDRFGSAKGMRFFFVGNFDIAKLKPLIGTYIASLPAADIPTAYQDLKIRPVSGVVKQAVYSGAEPKSSIVLEFTGPASFSTDERMKLDALIAVLNIKMVDVLREKLSLVYSASAGGNMTKVPYEHYSITLNVPLAPENVDKAIAATFAEIQKMKDGGISEADLNKVKTNWTVVYRRNLKENGYWMGQLVNAAYNGTDPAATLTYEQRTNALTANDVQEAAKRYFRFDNYVQMVLYPANAAPADAVRAAGAQ